jgi:hypothetical protein
MADPANNQAARAGNVAAHVAGQNQKIGGSKGSKIDQETLARIIAEENEAKGRLPKYPGLERWKLVEKMGDGAFSNVYKAKDLEGNWGEVAIKVVRKFEMNSQQVRRMHERITPVHSHHVFPNPPFPTISSITVTVKV